MTRESQDVFAIMRQELQVESFHLPIHDADRRERWFANCAQVLAAITDPVARQAQAMSFAMGLAVRGVPSDLVLRQLGEQP